MVEAINHGAICMRKLWKSRDGNVAILFAAAFVPLALMIAGAIDVSLLQNADSKVKSAADAAALAAVRAAVDSRRDNPTGDAWRQAAQEAAVEYFSNNLNVLGDTTVDVPNVKIDEVDGSFRVTVDYHAKVQARFLRFAGWDELNIKGTAFAQAHPPKYLRVNFVVDTSPSMGIGATVADQSLMYSKLGCAISCHYNDVFGAKDNLAQVRTLGAVLRMDVAKDAIVKIIEKLKLVQTAKSQFEIGVYAFGNSLIPVESGTTDLDVAISGVRRLELTNASHQGGTNAYYSLSELAAITKAGGGSAGDNRTVFTVLLTDGVDNRTALQATAANPSIVEYYMDPNFRNFPPQHTNGFVGMVQSIDPAGCSPLKGPDQKVITMELEYLIPQTKNPEARLAFIRSTLLPLIKSNMAKCATDPSMAFSANTPSEILLAADKIYNEISKANVRLAY